MWKYVIIDSQPWIVYCTWQQPWTKWANRSDQFWHHSLIFSIGYQPVSLQNTTIFCFYGLVQERRNSIANALELYLSCTNQSIWSWLIVSCHWLSVAHSYGKLSLEQLQISCPKPYGNPCHSEGSLKVINFSSLRMATISDLNMIWKCFQHC